MKCIRNMSDFQFLLVSHFKISHYVYTSRYMLHIPYLKCIDTRSVSGFKIF